MQEREFFPVKYFLVFFLLTKSLAFESSDGPVERITGGGGGTIAAVVTMLAEEEEEEGGGGGGMAMDVADAVTGGERMSDGADSSLMLLLVCKDWIEREV